MNGEIFVSAKINPTEDKEKVKKAINNIFPLKLEINDEIKGKGDLSCLLKLKEMLAERKIRDSVRQLLLNNKIGNKTYFYVNKQAAFVNIVNISDEELSPLGDIKVEIRSDDIDKIIDWLTEH